MVTKFSRYVVFAYTAQGVVMYEIKWLGYEKKADRTWEPESNL